MKPVFRFAALIALLAAAVSAQAGEAPANAPPTPVLVELFTSEGCSSCPPADALLQRMDRYQPIAGAELIVLSEHVDYWNHLGWSDPYSSAFFSERQESYGRALGLETVYTPQMIVDGNAEFTGGSWGKASQALTKAAIAPKIPVTIEGISVEPGNPQSVRMQIKAESTAARHSADVFVAFALDHAESQVLHGENGGRRLTHVAVAQSIKKIGRLEKGRSSSWEAELKLKPGADPSNLRVIVFLQEDGPGKVIGAAMRQLGH